MATFGSSVDATTCAKNLQIAFQSAPIVSVRIGLHAGDVVFKDGNAFGDAVNIASRVESMGIPGAVLLSSNIRNQIKNKPEFKLVSLGRFEFKNIQEGMTVYALANQGFPLPKKETIKGKFKTPPKKTITKKYNYWLPLIIVGFLAGWLLWLQYAPVGQPQPQLLDNTIREEKVAVSVFENFTGDKELDALGYLGSEWVSSGLRELKIRTVSPEMVRRHMDKVGILPNNQEGKPSFAEITGAKYVISGSYFLEGENIVLNTRLSSTETGEELRNFPQLREHKNKKEKLVEDTRQYLLGYWVSKKEQQLPKINPPKYEAYQIYFNQYKNNKIAQEDKALAIDPNFFLARGIRLYHSVVNDEDSVFYTNKAIIDNNWDKYTEYEQNQTREAFALWEGNYEAAFKAVDANYRIDSDDFLALHESGFIASRGLNKVNLAIERYEKIFNRLELYEDQVFHHTFRNYMNALNRAKAYRKTTDFYFGLSEKMKKQVDFAIFQVYVALIYQNRIEEVKKLIKERGTPRHYLKAAYTYAYIYPTTQNPFEERLRKNLHILNDFSNVGIVLVGKEDYLSFHPLVDAYYILKDWDKAKERLFALKKTDWFKDGMPTKNQQELWVEAKLGCVYAQQGKRQLALEQLDKVLQLGNQYHSNHHSHFLRGTTPYLIARIYALLNEKEKAIIALKESIEQGKIFDLWKITFDIDFVNLKGYPPFEELIQPKG